MTLPCLLLGVTDDEIDEPSNELKALFQAAAGDQAITQVDYLQFAALRSFLFWANNPTP